MSAELELGTLPISVIPVGSRVTCTPPPQDTDRDWLVLLPTESYDDFSQSLLEKGWEVGGSLIPIGHDERGEDAHFNSFTKGVDNLITTASPVFHRRFLAASSVAFRLNLLNKQDRIALFQAVLYAAICAPEFEPMAYTQEEAFA